MNVEQAKQVLKEAGYFSLYFQKDDISLRACEMGTPLTPEQIDDVVSYIENKIGADIGINWDTIEYAIQEILKP